MVPRDFPVLCDPQPGGLIYGLWDPGFVAVVSASFCTRVVVYCRSSLYGTPGHRFYFAVIGKNGRRGLLINTLMIIMSTAYLVWSAGAKALIDEKGPLPSDYTVLTRAHTNPPRRPLIRCCGEVLR